ncbi:hypothetical protein ACSXBY_15955 (plasmid) [Clostridium perfringens]|uniref:hypothetical protein n=1 Tax=Clostridium perfringens TaxID=1502 RepID=UPI002A7A0834|nr:hypothetical protein [Clostridium perfringens]
MRLVTLSIILSVIAVILAFINVCIKYDKYLDYSNSKKTILMMKNMMKMMIHFKRLLFL